MPSPELPWRPTGGTPLTLVGGGWDAASAGAVWGPFLERAGARPTVACLVLDEGDGTAQAARWAAVLRATAPCDPVPLLVPEGDVLDPARLHDADALLVCGGLTPAYAGALAPVAGQVRAWLAAGDRPYAGFSAGAALAADLALVGGWRDGGVPVCPEDAAEDLDQVQVEPGLGLLGATVEVHCAQWGTLPRLLAALARTPGRTGLALDEDTALHLDADGATVAGSGAVRVVTVSGSAATVVEHRARR